MVSNMLEISMLVVIGALLSIVMYQEHIHYKERKDLYNRLMAKDLHEYREFVEKPKKKLSSNPRRDRMQKVQQELEEAEKLNYA